MSVPESANTATNEPTKHVPGLQDRSDIQPHWLRINGVVRHSGFSRTRIYEFNVVGHLGRNAQIVTVAVFGKIILLLILAVAIFIPAPTEFQYQVFRIALALAAASVAALIPGILDVQIAPAIRASGAMAVFAVVYFCSPARLDVSRESFGPAGPIKAKDTTPFIMPQIHSPSVAFVCDNVLYHALDKPGRGLPGIPLLRRLGR